MWPDKNVKVMETTEISEVGVMDALLRATVDRGALCRLCQILMVGSIHVGDSSDFQFQVAGRGRSRKVADLNGL